MTQLDAALILTVYLLAATTAVISAGVAVCAVIDAISWARRWFA